MSFFRVIGVSIFLLYTFTYSFSVEEKDLVQNIGTELNIKFPEVIYQKNRFDALFEDAEKLHRQGEYELSDRKASKYNELTFSRDCRAYHLQSKNFAGLGRTFEKKEYEKLFEICRRKSDFANSEVVSYFDNEKSGIADIDIWKYYYHVSFYYQQERLGKKYNGTFIFPDYDLEYPENLSYLFAKLFEEDMVGETKYSHDYYAPLLNSNHQYTPYAMILFYHLYNKEFLSISDRVNFISQILKFEKESYVFATFFKNTHEVTYATLAQIYDREDLDKQLYYSVLAFIEHKNDESNNSRLNQNIYKNRLNVLNTVIEKRKKLYGNKRESDLFEPLLGIALEGVFYENTDNSIQGIEKSKGYNFVAITFIIVIIMMLYISRKIFFDQSK